MVPCTFSTFFYRVRADARALHVGMLALEELKQALLRRAQP
jgi:hypothetical protein